MIAYTFLAAINDTRKHEDLLDIFVPLVKKAFNNLFNSGISSALIKDLKDTIDSLYDLDIPYPVLRAMIDKIAQETKKLETSPLIINTDYSFQAHSTPFIENDENISKYKDDIVNVENAYTGFLQSRNVEKDGIPSVFEFIESNKKDLSSYFSKREMAVIQNSKYLICAEFINLMKSNSEVYNTLRRIYLGSIITAYLTLPPSNLKGKSVSFLIDTSFLLSFLGLQSEESRHTAKAIMSFTKKLSYNFCILSITVDEIYNLLMRFSRNYQPGILPALCDPESLEAACFRRRLRSSDLMKIASGLRNRLRVDQITIVKVTDEFSQEAEKSEVYKKIQHRKHNPEGAPHDGIAAYYVQKTRGFIPQHFTDAACWFLTDTKYSSASCVRPDGSMFEIIRADYLLNVIWFSSPNFSAIDVSDAGLSKLVRNTIDSTAPDTSLLREFDSNIKRFAADDISNEDLVVLANTNACKSVDTIISLNSLAKDSPDKFRSTLFELVASSRKEMATKEESANQLIKDLTVQNEQLKEKVEIEKQDSARKRRMTVESEILRLDKIISSLESIYSGMKDKAVKRANSIRSALIISAIAVQIVIILLCFVIGWQTMEQYVYVMLNAIPTVFCLFFFLFTSKSLNLRKVYKAYVARKTELIAKEMRFDLSNLKELIVERTKLQELLKDIS